MKVLFQKHIQQLQNTAKDALADSELDSVWIHAGKITDYFLDDTNRTFRVNPHFNHFVPYTDADGCWLHVDGKNKPHLYFYFPQDYWYSFQPAPQDFWTDEFDWTNISQHEDIKQHIKTTKNCAYIGEFPDFATDLGFSIINPKKLLDYLHFYRVYKTEYELECMRRAQKSAAVGHQAAKDAFFAGKTEFEINSIYLLASQQLECNVPYGNIVAINENGAVLHYTKSSLTSPAKRYSCLIDVGTTYLGYIADITRTYALEKDEFADMIDDFEVRQKSIVSDLAVGKNYLEMHIKMHHHVAEVLHKFKFVSLSPEQIFEEGITRAFFPHGLGHLLGLQTHDVAGHMVDHHGTIVAPPSIYPSLRFNREIEPHIVFTVEPGIYFIKMLLEPWRTHKLSQYFNWEKIDLFSRYGGIRIEDNVFFHQDGRLENMTRDIAEPTVFK